jgi:hypothetical protein
MDITITLPSDAVQALKNELRVNMGPTLPGISLNDDTTLDYSQLGEQIDYAALSNGLDYDRLAKMFTSGDIASHFSTRDIAEDIDIGTLASEIDIRDLASEIDTSDLAEQVAGNIDMSDVARELAGEIDYSVLAYEIDKNEIHESREHDKIARYIVKELTSNAEFRKTMLTSLLEMVCDSIMSRR